MKKYNLKKQLFYYIDIFENNGGYNNKIKNNYLLCSTIKYGNYTYHFVLPLNNINIKIEGI